MAEGFRIAEAFVEVHARTDRVGPEVDRAVAALPDQAGRSAERAGSGIGARIGKGLLGSLTKIGRNVATNLGTVAGGVAFVGSAALTAAPLVAKAAGWVVSLAKSAGAASPALAALAAGGLFVALTMKQIGPAILTSLGPIADGFTQAGAAAAVLAVRGVRPLAAEFARLGMPVLAAGMDRIAVATNGVVTRFLQWGNSTAGIGALRSVVDATSGAMEKLGPHVSRTLESFGNMIGRIAGVSLAAGANGLSGVLDKLSGWFDRVNAATVQSGLDGLKEKYIQVRDAISTTVGWVRSAVTFWQQYRTEIGLVQDALFVLAIAFGGPVVAVVATVGLIIRHWDQLKAAWQGVVDYFTATPAGMSFMESLRSAVATVIPAVIGYWNLLRDTLGPILQEIWTKISTQLVPAIGQFLVALAPVVAFCINVLGPIVVGVWQTILRVISGAIDIITGIIQVFTAVLTGNWGLLWTGIKSILSGAWQAITAIISGALNLVKGIFSGAWNAIAALISTVWGRIKSTVSGAASAVVSAISGAWNSAKSATSNAWNSLVSSVSSGVSRALAFVRALPGQILGALGNLGSLLYNAGQSIIQGLINGIKAMVGSVKSAISSVLTAARNLLPFSPAKEGPFSGKGWTLYSGRSIVDGLTDGVHDRRGALRSALRNVVDGAQGGLSASLPAGGSGAGAAGRYGGDGGLAGVLEQLARTAGLTVNVTQTSGSPAETGRYVALALRGVG